MNEEVKKIVRKFNTQKNCLYVAVLVLAYLIYCLVAFLTLDWFQSYKISLLIGFVAVLFLGIVVSILIQRLFEKTVYPILIEEADADKYYSVMKNVKYLRTSLYYFADAAYFAGDYQTAVNIYTVFLQEGRLPITNKLLCLSRLENICFELRDFEKLRTIENKCNEYSQRYPSNSISKKAIGYSTPFLNGDYEECKRVCLETEKTTPADNTHNLPKAYLSFLYALACYENGEKEEARATFELVLTNTPKLYWAELAKKYIEAIDRGIEVVISDHPIVPEENVQLSSVKVPTKKKRIVSAIIAVAVLCWILAIYFLSTSSNFYFYSLYKG